ncbi:uncharacterized protein [Panulirus ornatus]|uniref:uncharacterized protein n=1 Tax=Panulirus ornatus TaxID=150431 RepID=UPI003A8BEB31
MPPRPASPAMDSVCGRESSVSPPTVVAPLAIKPAPLTEAHPTSPVPTEQQRLLYQLALAERLRLASAGLAWARPPLSAHHHHLQEASMMGGLMGGHLMGSLGSPLMGGLGSAASLGGALMGGQGGPPPAAFPPPHPLYGYRLMDPRALLPRVGPEEPKPQHSYIGLIAMAILSSPDKKLVLSDIYQYILDHYPYFRSRGPGWRNSIRHNLSLNDCFIKAGRSANGKGHYWAIHPANLDDFRRGDFRRRRAQRRVRKHLGLPVDDDSDPEALSPTPAHTHAHDTPAPELPSHDTPTPSTSPRTATTDAALRLIRPKRQFDVLSLLAPDRPPPHQTDVLEGDHCMDVADFQPGEQRPQVSQDQALHLGHELHFKIPEGHRLEASAATTTQQDLGSKVVTEDPLQQVREKHQLQVSDDPCDHLDRACRQLNQHHNHHLRAEGASLLQVGNHQHLVAQVNHHLQVSSCHHLRVAEDLHPQGSAEDRVEVRVEDDLGDPAGAARDREPHEETRREEEEEEKEEEDVGCQQSTPPCWLGGGPWPRLAHVATLTTSCKLSTTALTTPYKLSTTTTTLVTPCRPTGENDNTGDGTSSPTPGPFCATPPTPQQRHLLPLAASLHPAHTLIPTSPHPTHTLTSDSTLPAHNLISTSSPPVPTLTPTSIHPSHTLACASSPTTHTTHSSSPKVDGSQ